MTFWAGLDTVFFALTVELYHMDQCPHCGTHLSGETVDVSEDGEENSDASVCPKCGTTFETNGKTEDGRGSDVTEDAWDSDATGATRREVLAYGGGSALLTWGAMGAGWFAFIYEPTSAEEDVVREYVDALDRAHFHTASQLFHEDAPGEAWSATEIPDVGQVDLNVKKTEIVDRQEDVDIATVQELALVVATISIEGAFESQTKEVGFVVAKNMDGEWELWEDR
jgi:hypothetical protein